MFRDIVNELPEKTKKAFKSPLMRRVLLCTTLALAPVAACSPKTQSWLNNADITVDKVPDDICVVNKEPKVINISTESDGDINFVYVRKDGSIVSKHYTVTVSSFGTKYGPQGEFIFPGGYCPPQS